jgi:hypothetical protein
MTLMGRVLLKFLINRRVESHVFLAVIFQPDPANPTHKISQTPRQDLANPMPATLWLSAEALDGEAA